MPEPPDRIAWEIQLETFAGELLDLLEHKKTDVYFGDEAGFEGDPRPRSKWVKRGTRPTQGYYGGHIRQNVVGAVNPHSGQLVSLIVPHCDTEVFQAFLDTMATEVPRVKGRRVVLESRTGCERATEQFQISDGRSAAEVAAALMAQKIQPVWKDWDEAILTACSSHSG